MRKGLIDRRFSFHCCYISFVMDIGILTKSIAMTSDGPKNCSNSSSSSSSNIPDLDEILDVAKEAAILAGEEVRRVWWQSSSSSLSSPADVVGGEPCGNDGISRTNGSAIATKSSNVDLVTETDERCEALITEHIRRRFPTHKIIGEESSGPDCRYVLTDEPTWTVDPIDGTTNFVHRLGLSCILVAFVHGGDVKVGVTYNPTSEDMFWAVRGRGAFLQTRDGTVRRIRVSNTTRITEALVAMDPGYGRDDASIHRYLSVQGGILRRGVRNVRTYGCSGLALANVACGRFDVSFEEGSWEGHTGPKIWDLCAGKLLVEEAGGVTRDVTHRAARDRPMDILQRSSFAAATPELADQVLDVMYSSGES